MNREAWLAELASRMTKRIEDASEKPMPKCLISVGFPSRGAFSAKRQTIGQCWDGMVSADGCSQLFISPVLVDPVVVAATVAHEQVHANVGVSVGHKGEFVRVVRSIGLEGKPTATVPGKSFIEFVQPILKDIGPYPHVALKMNPTFKPQSTNVLKVVCLDCGYVLRTTAKWLDSTGAPLCPCNLKQMVRKK
jgi:hypothetical protein